MSSDNSLNFETKLNKTLSRIDQSLSKALEKVSEGATSHIIEALNKVISDFNNNLVEQFGDNFKQLNEAVKSMVVWQENYKIMIEKSEEHIKESIKMLEMNAQYTKDLTERFSSLEKIHNDMSDIIKTNENQINSLETHMKSFKNYGRRS